MKPKSPVNILLVDDERANLLALSAVLENLDANLIFANSGEEALRQALLQDFAVILLDFYMPTMGGLEVAQIIRTRSETPIIFITASGPEDFPIEEAYSLGAVDYFTKPYNATVLKSKVAFFVELHKRTEALAASERARYLSELNDKDGRIRLILENAKGYSFIVTNVEGMITEWEGDASLVTGWYPEEAVGQSIAMIFTAEDRAQGRPGFELSTAATTGYANDKRWHMRKDGSRFYADGVMVPLKDAADQIHGFTKIFRDATSEKLALLEVDANVLKLQESRALFSLLLESSVEGIYGMGPDSSCTFLNAAGAAMLGYLPEELVGRTIHSVIHHHKADGSFYPVEECRIGTASREGRADRVDDEVFWHKDGTPVPVSYSVSPIISDGKPAGAVITFTDVSERRRNEVERERLLKEVQISEERYRTLFESVDQGFCIVELLFDSEGSPVGYKIVEMNPAYQRLTGLQTSGDATSELLPDSDKMWLDTYSRVATTGESVRFELQDSAVNRWFDIFVTPIGTGIKNKLAVLSNDVTERKRTEESLRRLAADLSEADRRKSEFLATLAHELRNPLAPIRNGLGILRLSGDNVAATAKTREMMERQVNHMVHLVDDLLDISRISGGKVELKKEPIALKELIKSAVETSLPLIEAGKHELVIENLDESILLNVDPIRIAQVISNLLNNAAKYTQPHGKIEIHVTTEGNEALLSVKDNGIGIPADALPTIFEMFNQVARNMSRAQGGLGIGLTLVRQIVEMHGGTVDAFSTEGNGSTFVVRLPITTISALSSAEQAMFVEQTNPLSLRIMVVDDNVDAADSLSMLLQLNGHTLSVANDGHAAVKLATTFKPHLAFLDIGMPGMNGYETAIAIRKIEGLENIILVALTGWGAERDRDRSREAGFNDHLTKPAQISSIEALLAKLEPSFH